MKLNIKKDLFCKMCSLQFDKKYVYDVHLSLVHKKFKSSTGRIQSRFDETVDEKENMDLGEQDAFESTIQNPSTNGSLREHIKATKKGKKLYKCLICDYNFTKKSNLKTHIDAIHEGKKPHKCSICDYSCTRKASFKIHIDAIHEGKKPHKC